MIWTGSMKNKGNIQRRSIYIEWKWESSKIYKYNTGRKRKWAKQSQWILTVWKKKATIEAKRDIIRKDSTVTKNKRDYARENVFKLDVSRVIVQDVCSSRPSLFDNTNTA